MNERRFYIFIGLITCLATVLFLSLPAAGIAQDRPDAGSIERISPESAMEKLDSGEAVLVCAYDDQTCSKVMIPGAISKDELARKRSSLSKDQEIIFYCA